MTKYYVSPSGEYLGGFDGVEPPTGAIEISSPPEHGFDKWTGTEWDTSKRPKNRPTKTELKTRIDEVNSIPEIKQVLNDILDTLA